MSGYANFIENGSSTMTLSSFDYALYTECNNTMFVVISEVSKESNSLFTKVALKRL